MTDEYERLREQRDAIEARQKKKADEVIVRKCADIVMQAAREYNRSAMDRRKDGRHDLATELESKALVCVAVHQQILREFEL
jgi:hypothetical protein